MDNELSLLLEQAVIAIDKAKDLKALDDIRVHYLGKNSQVTGYLKKINQVSASERPALGQKINILKEKINNALEEKVNLLKAAEVLDQLKAESVDVTLPGRRQTLGSLHPITLVRQRIETIFKEFGFAVAEGLEIENDHYNFAALNIPLFHPARSMVDTFYFEDGLLLRTHTSPVQIHFMESHSPPFRMIAIGRVFRRDFDLTHTPMFHQVEGLVLDEKSTFSDLKGLLTQFLQAFFNHSVALRFRPSYFPFTEPSAEVDMSCLQCKGQGCRICGDSGWLEVLGCGMVHPHVLKQVKIDSEQFKGFAFGIGFDRLALLYYQIPDLRMLFENDLRFLKQFS